jgi:hypothetical protein
MKRMACNCNIQGHQDIALRAWGGTNILSNLARDILARNDNMILAERYRHLNLLERRAHPYCDLAWGYYVDDIWSRRETTHSVAAIIVVRQR